MSPKSLKTHTKMCIYIYIPVLYESVGAFVILVLSVVVYIYILSHYRIVKMLKAVSLVSFFVNF